MQLCDVSGSANMTEAAAKSSSCVTLWAQGPDRVHDRDRWALVTDFREHLSNCMLGKSILDIKIMTFFFSVLFGLREQKCCLCSVHLSGRWHLRCGGILQCNRGDPMVNSLQTSPHAAPGAVVCLSWTAAAVVLTKVAPHTGKYYLIHLKGAFRQGR